MPVITKERTCAVCDILMPSGERFKFVERRWHGRTDFLPAHVKCTIPVERMAVLEAVIALAMSDSYEI